MNDWDEITLEEVCKKVTDGSHQSPKAFNGGYPMLSVKDMNEFGFDVENSKKISKEDYLKLSKQGCKPEINDILIAKDGSVLKHIFMVKDELEAVLLSSIAIVRPIVDKIYPKYLVYSIVNPSFKKYILNNFLSGSGVPRIVLKDFKKIIFNLPPLLEQKAIANVLTAFDDKIELLQQQNQTLETIAQTIFKEWFGKHQVGDELPEGWRVVDLQTIIEIGSSKRIFASEYLEVGIPFFRGKEITELSKGNSISSEIFISEDKFEELKSNSGVPKENDILLTSVGTIGNTYMVEKDDKFYFKDGNLTWIKNYNTYIDSFFIYEWFKSKNAAIAIEEIKIGSTQQAITISSLNTIEIVIPSEIDYLKFRDFFKINIEKRQVNQKQIQSLTKTRDTLLPKLMSGQVRVKM